MTVEDRPATTAEAGEATGRGRRIGVWLLAVSVAVVCVAGIWSVLADSAPPPELSVSDVRSGERVGTTVAVYATIDNRGGDDRLIRVSSPVAARGLVHSTNDVGVMGTSEGIEVPGATTVRLVPGGDHVMLEGVGANLLPDDSFALRLEFERAGPVEVEVEVVPLESLVEGEGP